ncbi:sulfotransferase [Acrocarpospora catenulata]|uniref:sulfotransferase n=1 Tax=Acrocarpospora catenulata TaxID=2836182 RepID=UPI001BDA1CA6|nr:sulfotransferase [Acrocarpospora catenulata]
MTILVTGLPRSGTSWTGQMLRASGELVYVNEPLNPERDYPGVLNGPRPWRFQYICADNEADWLPAFTATARLRYRFLPELRRNRDPGSLARLAKHGTAFTLGRLRGRRALLDDPFALFSAGWFATRLGCQVIILVREAVPFVGSWQHLGWTVYFHELLEQPLLTRDHPGLLALREHVGSQDRLAKAAALWRAARDVTATIAAGTPGVRVVGYEALAADPLAGFRDLYEWCGLPWTDRAARLIHRACTGSAAERPFAWSGLTRTAFRRTDSAAAATRSRLSPAEARRVTALVR